MTNSWEGKVFYESAFDPRTGALVRVSTFPEPHRDYWKTTHLANYLWGKPTTPGWKGRQEIKDLWAETFGSRDRPFSPVPETLDIQITNKCHFGCEVCYQNSTSSDEHADKDLIEGVLKSFKMPPYQVAFGGGEPTTHPDFPEILRLTREFGSVPNYTTAGYLVRDDIIAATNEFCGGVALTYHVFKGAQWFRNTYLTWHEALAKHIQRNVHVIADNTILKALTALQEMLPETGPLNLVLLAYYPLGRGTLKQLMPKSVYQERLPKILAELREQGCQIAFSEGLLPYFFSRPELGIEMRYAERAEGFYSAYVDRFGRMSSSSFDPPRSPALLADGRYNHNPSYKEASLQASWDRGQGIVHWESHHMELCDLCPHSTWCHAPEMVHSMVCNYLRHNDGAPLPGNKI